jgi:hypothetical protein
MQFAIKYERFVNTILTGCWQITVSDTVYPVMAASLSCLSFYFAVHRYYCLANSRAVVTHPPLKILREEV